MSNATLKPDAVAGPEAKTSSWYADWQHAQHAVRYDGPSGLDRRNLIRHFDSFSDVRLLQSRLGSARACRLLEVGCATGEFARYLQLRYVNVQYWGCDVSEGAIERARRKYPDRQWLLTDPGVPLAQTLAGFAVRPQPHIAYARDVVHHQTRPFEFLAELMQAASELVVVRLRTRDQGPTEFDPDQSCQFHYAGWMPYLVLNLDEVVEAVRAQAPDAELMIRRHHQVLGGHGGRHLPKDCYLPQTGTAETALGILLETAHPGRVTIDDASLDSRPRYTLDVRLRTALREFTRTVLG